MKFRKKIEVEVRGASDPQPGTLPDIDLLKDGLKPHPHHSRTARWLAPAFAACIGAAPLAQSWGRDEAAGTTAVQSASQDGKGVAWLSGGLGEEGRNAMQAAARDYNVHVLFSNRDGAYLADIPFRVLTAAGQEIESGTSEGPMLYLRLPAGNFKVAVKVDGAWQTRSVRVLPKGNPVSLIFLGRGDTQ